VVDPLQLQIRLELPLEVVRGEFVIGSLRVENHSSSSCRVSSRLNLLEGDVRLLLTGPGGVTRLVYGAYQPDTGLRQAELAPTEALESGLNLFYTSIGPTFSELGLYQVQVEYDASVTARGLTGPPVSLHVGEPAAPEAPLMELALNRDVTESITRMEIINPGVRKLLERLANEFPSRKEGVIAGWVLAASATGDPAALDSDLEGSFRGAGPLTLARWLSAIAPPVSTHGSRLRKRFLSFLEQADFPRTESERARQLIMGEPFRLSDGD